MRRALLGRPASEQPFLIGEYCANVDAVVADAVLAQLVRMRAPPHLYHRHHAPQSAVDLDLALHNDRVRQEGGAIGTETQVGVAVFEL